MNKEELILRAEKESFLRKFLVENSGYPEGWTWTKFENFYYAYDNLNIMQVGVPVGYGEEVFRFSVWDKYFADSNIWEQVQQAQETLLAAEKAAYATYEKTILDLIHDK